MSSAVATDERARRVPPRPVAAAVWLMWAALAVGVAAAIVLSADDIANAYGPDGDDELDALSRVLFPVAGVVLLAVAALWALLTVRVRQGRNRARVTTWVGAPIVAAILLVLGATQSGTGFVVATVVLLAGACLLLARPESSAYFRASSS
jgi:uncharacterized membrane protein YhaH (DUF805 family)